MNDRKIVVCETHGLVELDLCGKCASQTMADGPLNGKDQWFWHRIKWIRQICKEAGAGEDTMMEVDAIGTFALRTLSQMHLPSVPPGMEFPPRNDTPLSAEDVKWQEDEVAKHAYRQGYREALQDSDPIKHATVLAIIEECALQAVCAAPNDGRDHAECPFALKDAAPQAQTMDSSIGSPAPGPAEAAPK